jgi:hypothetical protein
MADVDSNLDTVLPDVHAIFAEQSVDKDLSSIKRIKKIVTDSHQIVQNREDEIKEVVRGKIASHCVYLGLQRAYYCVNNQPIHYSIPLRPKHKLFTALQSKVEGLEQAVESNDSVHGCEKKIRELENQKRQLLRQV